MSKGLQTTKRDQHIKIIKEGILELSAWSKLLNLQEQRKYLCASDQRPLGMNQVTSVLHSQKP